MLKSYLLAAGVRHSIMVNGDDSLVVVERSSVMKLQDLTMFSNFGFNMKFEVAYSIEQAEFCQHRLIYTDYGPTMARNPIRVLGRTGWSTGKLSPRKRKGHVLTLGFCERAASWGVPIASELANRMIDKCQGAQVRYINPWLYERYSSMKWWRTLTPPRISMETRLSFESAWGIGPDEQKRIEDSIRIVLTMGPTERHLGEFQKLLGC